jgi:hypothetical protein
MQDESGYRKPGISDTSPIVKKLIEKKGNSSIVTRIEFAALTQMLQCGNWW